MENSSIGIKLADGSFYPIMEEGTPSRKKLVLTTVKDDQANVQINLYRGEDDIEHSSYVGSLLIENIPSKEKGGPEIELIVGIDEEGNLSAEASESTSGERRTLAVSIGDETTPPAYDMPDFDLSTEPEEGFEPDFSYSDQEELSGLESGSESAFDTDFDTDLDADFDTDFDSSLDSDFGSDLEEPFQLDESFKEEAPEEDFSMDDLSAGGDFDPDLESDYDSKGFDTLQEEVASSAPDDEPWMKEPEKKEGRGVRKVLIALLVVLFLAFIGLLIYCLMNCLPGEENPPLGAAGENGSAVVVPAEDPGPATATQPEDTGSVAVAQPEAKSPELKSSGSDRSEPVQEVEKVRIEVEGVWYRIRRGDTLWDISSSFYNTPWLYGQIANENDIRNPDLIFTEQKIFIPTK